MRETTYRRPIRWACHGLTHPGVVREHNEDAIFDGSDNGHWAVADGMGGHQVGDLASEQIVNSLSTQALPETLPEAVDQLEDCLLGVNQHLQHYARQHLDGATMGSTLVDLLIRGRVGACFWAGDSRLYRFRRQQLTQITRDHSQVEDMLRMGLIDEAQAREHECRNVITRAVGVEEGLVLDLRLFDVQVGDMLLLCSDGLHGVLEPASIADILACRDPGQSVEQLMQAALDAGAPDNVSIIVLKGEPGAVTRSKGMTEESMESYE